MALLKKDSRAYWQPLEELPEVFLIMAVFNEEKVIAQKLDSIYQTDYPIHKLNLLIGSDASYDSTDQIIKTYQKKKPELQLISFSERAGKANTLNKILEQIGPNPKLTNAIFIFTDANVLFAIDTIYQLVKYFKDPKVAQVGAKVINRGMKKEGISFQENFYISRENEIKYHEGLLFGTMMGAFGACFAHKASLIHRIPKDHVVDDFYLTMMVLQQGFDCILNSEAVCYEDLPHNIKVEYNRKKRISIGNYQNLFLFWKTLIPKRPGLSFSFLSHKVLRWITPFMLILILASSFLLAQSMVFYKWVFCMLLLSFMIPFIDRLLQKRNVHFLLFRYITYFYSMNLALLHGFLDFITGRNQNIWEPTERIGH